MKCKRLFILAILLSSMLTVSAQKVTLNYQNQQLEVIFSSITRQTGLSLAYSPKLINLKRTASISVTSKNLNAVLDQLLSNSNIGYEVRDKSIFLFAKPEKPINKVEKKKEANLRIINGFITDEKGDPIIGANVVEKGTANGTITGIDGSFSFNAKEDVTLHVSLFVVWDKASAYALLYSISKKYASSGASTLVIWEAIKFLVNKTKSFDFEGSMAESIENSYRQFATMQKSYFLIEKYYSRTFKLLFRFYKG